MNADGSRKRRLTRSGADDGSPVWSPDGSRIAFTRNGFLLIYVMNADGSRKRNLTPFPKVRSTTDESNYSPSWSPDSQRIAFVNEEVTSQEHIVVIDADGSGRSNLTQGYDHDLESPVWSPAPG